MLPEMFWSFDMLIAREWVQRTLRHGEDSYSDALYASILLCENENNQ